MRRRGVDYTAYPPITGRRKSATAMLTEKNEKIIITNDNSLNNKNGVNKKVFLDRKKTVSRILMVFHFSSSCIVNSGYKPVEKVFNLRKNN